jgi:hypothetical protein
MKLNVKLLGLIVLKQNKEVLNEKEGKTCKYLNKWGVKN